MPFNLKKIIRPVSVFLIGLLFICAIIFFIFPLPGRAPVLMYHFIGSKQDAASSGNFVTMETFEKQMHFLKMFGYRVISLKQFEEIKSGIRKPRGREIVLTFDDGNPSVFSLAWPILKKYNFYSTQFLISEGLKAGTYGSVSLSDLSPFRTEPLMTWGAHSRTHPFLSQLSDADMETEIVGSKIEIEKELGVSVDYFAYPFGDFDARALRLAQKAGFHLAFTTSPKKLNGIKRNKYCLTRIKISENAGNLFIFWFKLTGLYEFYKLWRENLINPVRA